MLHKCISVFMEKMDGDAMMVMSHILLLSSLCNNTHILSLLFCVQISLGTVSLNKLIVTHGRRVSHGAIFKQLCFYLFFPASGHVAMLLTK